MQKPEQIVSNNYEKVRPTTDSYGTLLTTGYLGKPTFGVLTEQVRFVRKMKIQASKRRRPACSSFESSLLVECLEKLGECRLHSSCQAIGSSSFHIQADQYLTENGIKKTDTLLCKWQQRFRMKAVSLSALAVVDTSNWLILLLRLIKVYFFQAIIEILCKFYQVGTYIFLERHVFFNRMKNRKPKD